LSSAYYACLAVDDSPQDSLPCRESRQLSHWVEGFAEDLNVWVDTSLSPSRRVGLLSSWSQSWIKRVFDCALVLPALLLMLPLFLAIGLSVRLTSAGPVLFLQKRIGRYGRTFTIAKFRTLVHSKEIEHRAVTTDHNQHFTPIGQFLRRWKLDELPQLLNVLIGDMSLVGPRPKVREHRTPILRCRPGITGAATIVFAGEESILARVPEGNLESFYRDVILPAKRRLDAEYMAHATPCTDLAIVIKSLFRRWDDSVVLGLLNQASHAEKLGEHKQDADNLTTESNSLAFVAQTKLAILGTRGIPAQYGGFETFAEQLAVRLARRGVDVTVFCPGKTRQPDGYHRGVTLKYVLSRSLGTMSEVLWDVQCLWSARRDFDVVYMLGAGAGFATWLPRLYGSAVWVNSDGLEWKRAKWTLLQRMYLALAEALSVVFASRVIADADAISQYLRKRYPRLKKLSTVAYGVEISETEPTPQALHEWNLEPDSYYINVCRLEPENHVLQIIEAFECSNTTLPLVVLGTVDKPNAYVRSLLQHRSKQIRFVGTVFDQDRLIPLRYYSRGYFHGHSVGGTNPSLLEAMACSNLVIAHDNPFNRAVLGDSGLYWSQHDELVAIIGAVEERRLDAARLGRMAVNIVRSRYQWDYVADVYVRLLNEATNIDAARVATPLPHGAAPQKRTPFESHRGGLPAQDGVRAPETFG